MEGFGVVAAATGLSEQGVRIIGRLRKARERQKELVPKLDQLKSEIESINKIVRIVRDQNALHTATVRWELTRLEKVETELEQLLKELDRGEKGAAKQFLHQLLHGSSEERKRGAIMEKLGNIKSALVLQISAASVGVTVTAKKELVANAEAINRIDRFLKEELGDGIELKVAKLLKGRRPSNEGLVLVTRDELSSLNSSDDSEDDTVVEEADSKSSPGGQIKKTERIILRNMTKDQALMLCGPVGEDLWADISRIEIRDNKAEGESIQVNYAVSPDIFMAMLASQTQRVEAKRHSSGRTGRHDSFNSAQ